ncbi:MAG: hypothetical protein ACUVV5_07715 [Candidatus Aminicenantales bacterium]
MALGKITRSRRALSKPLFLENEGLLELRPAPRKEDIRHQEKNSSLWCPYEPGEIDVTNDRLDLIKLASFDDRAFTPLYQFLDDGSPRRRLDDLREGKSLEARSRISVETIFKATK